MSVDARRVTNGCGTESIATTCVLMSDTRNGRNDTKEWNRMGNKKPSWIDSKKSRWGKGDDDAPWLEFIQPLWGSERHVQVVKSWQNDWTQDFARVMVKTWMVGDKPELWDGGDEYVRVVLHNAHLIKVLGEPATLEQVVEIRELTEQVMAKPDPMAALGF